MPRDPVARPPVEDRGVLRFLTCGSVDDGKSTLIGRLLFDTKTLLTDTLATLQRTSEERGLSAPDLSLLTDGLTAEREQGITIDVAYRYFATARRKFIIADAPGHEQYTRNMVTAASTADIAILLIDARKGVLTQTRRHATISALLGIRQLILAVNKMDLVGFNQAIFGAIESDFRGWLAQHGEREVDLKVVPLSALDGDMVVERGTRLAWYRGPTLVQLLEDAPAAMQVVDAPLRFPVQWVCRPAGSGARGYAGRIEAGRISVGDEIAVLPGGLRSRVSRIAVGDESLPNAVAGQSIMLSLADERDISRGDMLVRADDPVAPRASFSATLCWLDTTALAPTRSYLLRQATRTVKARISTMAGGTGGKLDLHSLAWNGEDDSATVLNDIVRVQLRTQQPLVAEAYSELRATGSFILIDEASSNTVAAGVID